MKQKKAIPCCPVKLELQKRPLITANQAKDLEKIFKTLANNTRLMILHAFVRNNELCVTEIAEILGMKTTAVSNQLQRLVAQGIIINRRKGNHILYRILDPCVIKLLDNAWCLVEDINSDIQKGGLSDEK
jgi:DNA-binding transcriptional ArsR family regulator